MKNKPVFLPALAMASLALACSLLSGGGPTAPQTPKAQGAGNTVGTQPTAAASQPTAAATQPSGAKSTPAAANPLKNFPVPPNSTLDSNSADSDEADTDSGVVEISSTASVETVAAFYQKELPQSGWIYRYTDANSDCGVTQYWKTEGVYLRLDFQYEEGTLHIHGQYQIVNPDSITKYLPDFPLPAGAEMVDSSDTSWEFYIPEDFQSVVVFYQKQSAALNWTPKGNLEASEGSGGCDGESDCSVGGSSACPAGVEPMAAPTMDIRNSLSISYTLPNKNEVDLEFFPHGSAMLMDVSIQLNSLESTGLPSDLPIYPGAELQLAGPGSATFKVDADVDTVKKYYESQMPAAGWSLDGAPFEGSGSYIANWKKGDDEIGIMITPDQNGSMLTISCSSCK